MANANLRNLIMIGEAKRMRSEILIQGKSSKSKDIITLKTTI